MSEVISLDDLGTGAPRPKKKKKIIKPKTNGTKSVPASTAKKAKPAKNVTKPLKAKKNKTKPLDTEFDRDSIFDNLPTHNKHGQALPVVRQGVPSEGDAIAEQMDAVLATVPDSVKRDSEQFQEYLTMFYQCQKMSRTIEERFHDRKQPKDVYPLLKLYEQMREIIADLRAIKDVTELGDVLVEDVLSPMTEAMGAELIGYHQHVVKWLNANLTPDQISSAKFVLEQTLKKQAKGMQMAYEAGVGKVAALLTEEQG